MLQIACEEEINVKSKIRNVSQKYTPVPTSFLQYV
jgi:hypothetical protein